VLVIAVVVVTVVVFNFLLVGPYLARNKKTLASFFAKNTAHLNLHLFT
jgi:hypothetical protein